MGGGRLQPLHFGAERGCLHPAVPSFLGACYTSGGRQRGRGRGSRRRAWGTAHAVRLAVGKSTGLGPHAPCNPRSRSPRTATGQWWEMITEEAGGNTSRPGHLTLTSSEASQRHRAGTACTERCPQVPRPGPVSVSTTAWP